MFNFWYDYFAYQQYWNVVEIDDKHILFPLWGELHIYSFAVRPPIKTGNPKEDEKLPELAFDGRLEFKQVVAPAAIEVLN